MIAITEESLVGPMRVFINANTPAYLFKRLRQDPLVQVIAQTRRTQEIAQDLRDRIKSVLKPEDLVAVFALLTAASFKPFSELKPWLEDVRIPHEWGDYLKMLVMNSAPKEIVFPETSIPAVPPTVSFVSAGPSVILHQ